MKPRCKNCEYFDTQNTLCRVNPPIVVVSNIGCWPMVNPEDWCGRWRRNTNVRDPEEDAIIEKLRHGQ